MPLPLEGYRILDLSLWQQGSYATAMLLTITLWLTVAPLVAAGRKWRK